MWWWAVGDLAVETEPVELRFQGTGTDELGNTVKTWDTWTTFPERAYVEEQVTTKVNKSENRRQKVTTYLVIFDHEASVTGDERIFVPSRDLLLDMDGKPSFPKAPDGSIDHTEANCIEAVG